MRRSLVALVPAAAGLLLAACVGDRDSTAPRIAPSNSPSLDRPTSPACDATIKTDARAFFSSYPGDPVFTDVDAMAAAYGTGGAAGAAAATPFGLNIFNHIANARQTSRQRAGILPDVGGKLAHDVAACTNLGTLDATFAGTAIASGVFAVRGGAGDSPDAAIAKPDVYPRWGVEPIFPATWSTAYPRYLVYGVPGADASALGGESPTVATFTGFDVSSLPSSFDKSTLRVGICVKALIGDQNAQTRSGINLLIHNDLLEANSSPSAAFCLDAPTPAGSSLSTSAWFASITNRLTSIFSPASAWAQGRDVDFDSFTGGGPSSWSPQVFVTIAGSNVLLTFSTQPTNGFVYPAHLNFVVHAQTSVNGVPTDHYVNGVAVTVSVTSNMGLPAGACARGTLTVYTTGQGDATFDDVSILKAGGFTIKADGSYNGISTQSKLSNQFQIKNKGGTVSTCP
jgi:hypothetical protein